MKCVIEWILNEPQDGQPVEIKNVLLMQEYGEVQMLSSTNELAKILPTIETPILFIRNLNQMFRLVEPSLLGLDLEPKMCADKGNGFVVWPCKLKPNQYAPIIRGRRRECSTVKFSNFRMYNADPWLGNTRNTDMLAPDEVDFLLQLSEMSDLKSTPSGDA